MATNPPPPGAEGGLVHQLRAIVGIFGRYVSTRVRLMRLESKEAGAHLGKVVGGIIALAVLAGFGWLFVCVGLTALIAQLFTERGWVWAPLLVGGFHFLAVGIVAVKLKGMAGKPLFPLTTEELKKDQAWVDQQTQKKPR